VELFIPEAELADIMWSVPPPSLKEASETHDVTRVDHPNGLSATIETLITTLPGALFHTLPRGSPLFPVLSDEYTQPVLAPENEGGAVTDLYLLPALQRARLTKDEDEIAAIKHANQISSRAHEVVMRVLGMAVKEGLQKAAAAVKDRPLLPGEWLIEKEAEAEAVFVASCRREGCVASLTLIFSLKLTCGVALCIKPTYRLWQPPLELQHFITVVMIVSLHGDLFNLTIIRTRISSPMEALES
jgi:Xaa-Pro dipeptidase